MHWRILSVFINPFKILYFFISYDKFSFQVNFVYHVYSKLRERADLLYDNVIAAPNKYLEISFSSRYIFKKILK